MDAMIGKSLGKYQIVEQLGEGGMATVYKAYDAALERYVAIKIIRAASLSDPLFLGRFQREARALAKLDHPYILKVLDYGEQDGVPYLVMPFVGHGTLKQYTTERLPYDRAIGMVLPVAEALSYAHKRNIIHRDIKPANILFGESGEPILSDFGIAKMLDAGDQTQLTGSGLGIGTPAYMAPEQWNGVADERTDVYALGIVLYELLTSRCPFQAETPAAILIKQVQDPLPRPKTFAPDVPENVEAVIFKALAKDPSLRFQTMQEFIRAMNDVLQNKAFAPATPPTMVVDPNATVVAHRASVPMPLPASIPGIMQHPMQKKKGLNPIVIIGGVVAVVAFLVILFAVVIPKASALAKNKSTQTTQNGTQLSSSATQESTSGGLFGLGGSATNTPKVKNTPESVTVIDKLPTDIPVFIPNNNDVMTTQADQTLMFNYSTSAEPKVVQDFFLTEMKANGWELVTTTDMSSQSMVQYGFSKDNQLFMIAVYWVDNKGTYIQIVSGSQ